MKAPRHLGATSATVLVIASMIGAGVFTTSGFSLADLGSPGLVLLAWTVAGAIALLGAVCYGALAARLSESGGEYFFLTETVHPFVGFLAGWISLLAGFTAPIALAAAALQAYASAWLPEGTPPNLLGTAVILTAGALHGLRAGPGVLAQNGIVLVKLLMIAGLIAFGLPRLPAPPPSEAADFSVPAFAVSLVWISLSYSGWNAAVYVGGEVRDPSRNLPRALVAGTLLVTVVYLLLNAVFVYAAPMEELSGQEDIAAVATRALFGPEAADVVRAILVLALASSVLVNVMTGPRVFARMARDGFLPRWLRERGGVPSGAVFLQVALSVAFLWLATLRDLLGYIGYTLGLSTSMTVVGLVLLRRRQGAERVPIPGYPFVPALFVGATVAASVLMMVRRWQEPVAGLATIALGSVVYLLVRRRGARPGGASAN